MTPGTVVGGKYLLSRRIGQGAMGEVWAAINQSTGGQVALKLLCRPREELRKRLLREARACGKLRHHNIIDVHDVGETDDGEPFLVMALLTGETLADLLDRKGRLEPPHAIQIARDIGKALAAAHKAGIIHRDLKPANVFLHREDGAPDVVVKVLDFGVSKDRERLDAFATVAGVTVGSPAYMSPEQARIRPDLDHRTDLWSLGVVLFEMLAGKRPFDGSPQQAMAKIVVGPIPLVRQCVRGIDPALAAVVARCMERDPARRFSTAEELVAALDGLGRPVPAPPPSVPMATLGCGSTTIVGVGPAPMNDEEDLPTKVWRRDALGPMLPPRVVSPPGTDASTPIDTRGPTLPDPLESAPPPPGPLFAPPQDVPVAPSFDAPLPSSAEPSMMDLGAYVSFAPPAAPAPAPPPLPSTPPVVQLLGAPAPALSGQHRRALLAATFLVLGCVVLVLLAAAVVRARHPAPAAAPLPTTAPDVPSPSSAAAPPRDSSVAPASSIAPPRASTAPRVQKPAPKPSTKSDGMSGTNPRGK